MDMAPSASVARKNRLLTMLSFTVQSIDFFSAWPGLERMTWMMRQSNGSLTPAPRCSASYPWRRTRSNDEEGAESYERINQSMNQSIYINNTLFRTKLTVVSLRSCQSKTIKLTENNFSKICWNFENISWCPIRFLDIVNSCFSIVSSYFTNSSCLVICFKDFCTAFGFWRDILHQSFLF